MVNVDPAAVLAERPQWVATTIAFVFLVAVGVADLLTGREVSLSVFYVAPIALTTWFVNKGTGVSFALLSAVTWFLADDMGRPHIQPLVPYWNALVRLGFYLVMVFILAKLKEAHEHERSLSREDPTTGIANPRAFFEWGSREIERARRFPHPVTVIYIDCDDFKLVNDREGHATGDEVLREVGQALQGAVRDVDFVARIGGDEFAVLLPETDATGAQAAVRRIQDRLSGEMARRGRPVTFSVGAATFVAGSSSMEAALREADTLMYAAKTGGKNAARFAVFGKTS
jgi:diguanylate cyclase (GGDEF)-like protein